MAALTSVHGIRLPLEKRCFHNLFIYSFWKYLLSVPALFKAGSKSTRKVVFMSSNNLLSSFEGGGTSFNQVKKNNQYCLNIGKFCRGRRQSDTAECAWGDCGRPLWGDGTEAWDLGFVRKWTWRSEGRALQTGGTLMLRLWGKRTWHSGKDQCGWGWGLRGRAEQDGARPRRLERRAFVCMVQNFGSVLGAMRCQKQYFKRKVTQSKLWKELFGTCLENGLFEGKKAKRGYRFQDEFSSPGKR